jgi:hypothetical protein
MRYTIRLSILLTFVLATAPMRTESRGLEPPGAAPVSQSRLVVFETFMRPG